MAGMPRFRKGYACQYSYGKRARLRLSLRQRVEIDATIVIRYVNLAAVDDRRIEFIEKKLHAPFLRLTQHFERAVGGKMHGIVNQQASVDYAGVGVTIGNRADENGGVRVCAVA